MSFHIVGPRQDDTGTHVGLCRGAPRFVAGGCSTALGIVGY